MGEAHFTPDIDKRIIEGFLRDRETMLGELASETGLSRTVILKRAEELGLNSTFVQQCRRADGSAVVRGCLRCDAWFVSMGPQNRLCKRCRAKK